MEVATSGRPTVRPTADDDDTKKERKKSKGHEGHPDRIFADDERESSSAFPSLPACLPASCAAYIWHLAQLVSRTDLFGQTTTSRVQGSRTQAETRDKRGQRYINKEKHLGNKVMELVGPRHDLTAAKSLAACQLCDMSRSQPPRMTLTAVHAAAAATFIFLLLL